MNRNFAHLARVWFPRQTAEFAGWVEWPSRRDGVALRATATRNRRSLPMDGPTEPWAISGLRLANRA